MVILNTVYTIINKLLSRCIDVIKSFFTTWLSWNDPGIWTVFLRSLINCLHVLHVLPMLYKQGYDFIYGWNNEN
jgi:hypothetical protein